MKQNTTTVNLEGKFFDLIWDGSREEPDEIAIYGVSVVGKDDLDDLEKFELIMSNKLVDVKVSNGLMTISPSSLSYELLFQAFEDERLMKLED